MDKFYNHIGHISDNFDLDIFRKILIHLNSILKHMINNYQLIWHIKDMDYYIECM